MYDYEDAVLRVYLINHKLVHFLNFGCHTARFLAAHVIIVF